MPTTEPPRPLWASPMTWIVLGAVVLHTVGIGWGLPGSDGWDNDGVAPRDFLPGLADTFTPGRYYTYPPVHLALLAVLTLPITLVGVLRAPSHALGDIIGELLAPGYMTSIAYVARFVSMLMSIGVVLFAARMAEELRAHALGVAPRGDGPPRSRLWTALEGDFDDVRVRRAGWCVAAVVGLEASLTYYAHTTNLDVPYLFWGMAALLGVMRAIARDEPRRLRWAFAFAVLAVGTKDQAYALFGLSLPVVLLLARPRLRDVAIAAGLAVALFLVTDAVIPNPTGFAARVRFLTGTASQDFVEYTRDWSGRLAILRDAAVKFDVQLPKLAAPLFVIGLVQAMRQAKGRRGQALALLPLLVAVSFTVLFNWASLRTNARFLMPQAIMLAIYGGLAAEALLFAERRRGRRIAAAVALAVPLLLALRTAIAVDGNFVFDPRYAIEDWLREHVRPGETIETYGLNVYLPRFPEGRRVIRVGPEPLARRNRLPGVVEVEDAYDRAPQRDARFIVLSQAWVWRFLVKHPEIARGHRLSPTLERSVGEDASTRFFLQLVQSEGEFVLVHYADYEHAKWFPIVDVHGDTGRSIWVYERRVAAPAR